MIPATVLNVSEARDRLSDLMGRAFYRNETFVIARKGTPMVVLISIEEYNALQAARSEQAVGYDLERYEMQIKEWAEQYEAARATLETQHPALDQEEAERVELTALLDELEHPQVLPPLDNVTEIDVADFLTAQDTRDDCDEPL
jgi:prevent-host-death family protein